jgi:surfeit locus 1 family protein
MKPGFFTPRWIITTLLVLIAIGVMARLGFWQLDRLAQRRAFNASVAAQVSAPALDLNKDIPLDQLANMEYRPVLVQGVYDQQNEVILRNQVYNDQPGYHLLTPLRIAGSSQAVMVDRGFIPLEEPGKTVDHAVYAQPGQVTLQGILRQPHVPQFFGVPDPTLAPGQSRLDAWNAFNLPRIQQQVPYPLLPMYVEAAPAAQAQAQAAMGASGALGDLGATGASGVSSLSSTYPIASTDAPDLSEGPHLGYAFQWFSFAAILAMGYPFFVKKQLSGLARSGLAHRGAPAQGRKK